MVEAVMFWNEPNNKSHWDPELDPNWEAFAAMVKQAGDAVLAENPRLPRVLGGISPIDPLFIANMRGQGVLDHLDVVAVHGPDVLQAEVLRQTREYIFHRPPSNFQN
jgi:beta-xylosidase